MKKRLTKVKFKNWLKTPIGFYIKVTLILVIIVGIVDLVSLQFSINTNVSNFWLNLHASIVEVFLLGLFITRFNNLTKKEGDIREWNVQLEDFRGWKEPEAAYRLAGIIKRLSTNNIFHLDLTFCFLQGANLQNVNLSRANLSGANLSNANLSNANLSRANLYKADLSEADLSGANLSGAILLQANLSGANLSGAYLSGADLTGANLYKANLSKANLSGAYLSVTNLLEANLSEADLTGANLSGADLSGAYLSVTNLLEANLSEADLTGADLSGANLLKANLSGANLSRAILEGTYVDNVDWIKSLKSKIFKDIKEIESKYLVLEEMGYADDFFFTLTENEETFFRLREKTYKENAGNNESKDKN